VDRTKLSGFQQGWVLSLGGGAAVIVLAYGAWLATAPATRMPAPVNANPRKADAELATAPASLLQIGVGAGNGSRVDINGQLVVHGRITTPDYVFQPGYELMSIDEHAAAMRREQHLPHVQAARSKAGVTQVDVGARQQEMLEELEIAHLYIATLNERLAKLEAAVERLEKRD
jgi:hypothetical protein